MPRVLSQFPHPYRLYLLAINRACRLHCNIPFLRSSFLYTCVVQTGSMCEEGIFHSSLPLTSKLQDLTTQERVLADSEQALRSTKHVLNSPSCCVKIPCVMSTNPRITRSHLTDVITPADLLILVRRNDSMLV